MGLDVRCIYSSQARTKNYQNELTFEEFKEWLKKFDKNKDDRISKDEHELQLAIRTCGGWFSCWKSKRAVKAADTNFNGIVDDDEFGNLVEFAEKQLDLKIVSHN